MIEKLRIMHETFDVLQETAIGYKTEEAKNEEPDESVLNNLTGVIGSLEQARNFLEAIINKE